MIKPFAKASASLAVLALGAASFLELVPPPPAAADVLLPPTVAVPSAWIPPSYLDGELAWSLDSLDGPAQNDAGPRLRSRSAILADLDSGQILYAQRADEPASVASLTKLVSGLTLASTGPDLEQTLCVGPEQYPTRSGAWSKFETGVCHPGWDYLGAALVRSDNRGAMAFVALSGLPYDAFIDRMHQVSRSLRMELSSWSDPTGLEDENMASARDLLKAVVATAAHPELALTASAPWWQIETKRGPRRLYTTNRLRDRYEVLAAKTGYTDTARYCNATVVRTRSGRQLGVVVLGAPSSNARFQDTVALIEAFDRPS